MKVIGVLIGIALAVVIIGAVYALEAFGLRFALELMGFDITFNQAVGAVILLNFIAILFRPKRGGDKK